MSAVLAVAEPQHGVITHSQLLELGLTAEAIRHRVRRGRLHPIRRGVYAVGTRRISRLARWMAAVLACGRGAVLSHESAAALWGIRPFGTDPIHISVPVGRNPRQAGVLTHRRAGLEPSDLTAHANIPVTSIVLTFVDVAATTGRAELEAAIGEADRRDLIDPEALRAALARFAGWPGVVQLRETLDRHTFTLTDSELERLFLPIARRAGLPRPLTQQYVNGFRVDFYWPELGLVIETDGLRYHRTASQQSADLRRDQIHAAAGLTVLRFSHAQVAYEPASVEATLRAVARRL
jgi:very-short-patch-repair endonuclease/predicted transcriptional regulator of viral defense system